MDGANGDISHGYVSLHWAVVNQPNALVDSELVNVVIVNNFRVDSVIGYLRGIWGSKLDKKVDGVDSWNFILSPSYRT